MDIWVYDPERPDAGEIRLSAMYQYLNLNIGVHNVFFDGSVQSREDFVRYFTRYDTFSFLVQHEDVPVALFWLTPFADDTTLAYAHFAGFPLLKGNTKVVGRMVTDHVKSIAAKMPPESRLSNLIGLTPTTNTLAVQVALRCGFKRIATVERAIYNVTLKTYMDAVMTIYPLGE